jgi:hypothetical protein
MGEYFGFEIEERHKDEWSGYLEDIDPKYHEVLTHAMSDLCNWYGDKAHRQVDDWFTILYGMILQLEDVLSDSCRYPTTPVDLDFSDFIVKEQNE